MNSKHDNALLDVAEDCFATLAFLMPLCEEERDMLGANVPEDVPTVAARVEFSGPFAGSLVLTIDAHLLQPLAANMLGLLGACAASSDQQFDALKEMLNVVCGNLLPRIATPHDVFKVHSPEVLDAFSVADNAADAPPAAEAALWLDGGRAYLSLYSTQPLTTATA